MFELSRSELTRIYLLFSLPFNYFESKAMKNRFISIASLFITISAKKTIKTIERIDNKNAIKIVFLADFSIKVLWFCNFRH